MAWRLARSLEVLRREVNEFAPNRSRVSDGTLGDQAHADRASRHNPNDDEVVTALDVTNDVAGGCPIHLIARRIALHPHPNLAYIISDGEVAKRKTGFRWEPYRGDNRHVKHAHFAVGVGPDSDPRPPYDDLTPWGVAGITPPEDFMARLTDDEQRQLYGWTRDIHKILADPKDVQYIDKRIQRIAGEVRDTTVSALRRMAGFLKLPVRPGDENGV